MLVFLWNDRSDPLFDGGFQEKNQQISDGILAFLFTF